MKLFDGQVHVFELALLAVFTFLSYLIGYNLPIIAVMLLVLWPLLLIQMLGEGLIIGAFYGVRRLWRGPAPAPVAPPAERRRGVARFLWMLPFVAVAAGYVLQYLHTGTWFL